MEGLPGTNRQPSHRHRPVTQLQRYDLTDHGALQQCAQVTATQVARRPSKTARFRNDIDISCPPHVSILLFILLSAPSSLFVHLNVPVQTLRPLQQIRKRQRKNLNLTSTMRMPNLVLLGVAPGVVLGGAALGPTKGTAGWTCKQGRSYCGTRLRNYGMQWAGVLQLAFRGEEMLTGLQGVSISDLHLAMAAVHALHVYETGRGLFVCDKDQIIRYAKECENGCGMTERFDSCK